MIEKESIRENFSRGAENYDSYAAIQKEMAEELAKKIDGTGEFKKILEIGCGTGFFSKILTEKYDKSSFKFIDISEKMIDSTRNKIGSRENFEFLCCDGEKYLSGKYDLICSNAVFQWYEDVALAVKHYYTMLNAGGVLAFTTFGKENHFEFADSAERGGALGYRLNYKDKDEILAKLDSGIKIEFEEKMVEEEFENLREYFRYIKKIGAKITQKEKNGISLTLFKNIEKNFFEKYCKNGKITVTNHIYFFIIKKEKEENGE